MARLTMRLLGSFQVDIEALPVPYFGSNKVRALLAYLVVECQQAHNREKLAALFWPEMPAKRANANLSQALYTLRGILHDHPEETPYFLRTRETVQFNPDSNYWLDVDAFNAQLAKNNLKEANQLPQIQAAVELYRGDFLEGLIFDSSLAFDEWVLVQRQRLQRRMMAGLSYLAEAYADQGEVAVAIPYAWRQIEQDPLGEPAYRQLIRLLAISGQRNQALTQFNRLQILLAEELNIAPEPETVALCERIRNEEYTLVQDKPKGDNLPAFLTPLIGRQTELVDIQKYYEKPDCRLLTILGPGGSGKTRLALEVTRLYRKTFQHGVSFVPLNPVQAPESILPAIAEALDLPRGEQDDRQSQLINYLRGKNLLLLLDGFEHLLAGAGGIAEILRQAAGVKILVTSRTRLNIKGEQVYFLGGMRYPDMAASEVEIREADAVQLLVAGIQRTRPGLVPDVDELSHLLQICQQVRGMPLSILLAASWGATLDIEEIAGVVSRSLDFLVTDWADVPARQRSLRATFDHTWNLLSARQRDIFQGLSVFRGAFTRQAAQSVVGASPYELRSLMDRSLIWSKVPGWYEIHELLRQYGREKLAQLAQEEQDVCGKHSEYYLGQLARLGEDLKSAQQVTALSSIDLEHENYRAAWSWAASQGAAARVAQALEAVCLYYDLSPRYSDGESACRAAMEGLSQDKADVDLWLLQASLLTWQSRFTRLLGQPELAFQLLNNALVHLEKAKGEGNQASDVEAFITFERGNNHIHSDRAAATTCYQHSLEMYQSLDDTWRTAKVLARLGEIAYHAGSFQEAVQRYSESLALFQEVGDPRGIANALSELGNNNLRQGQISAGQQYIEDSIVVREQIGDRAGAARNILALGRACFYTGQAARGNAMWVKAFPILEDLGMRSELNYSMAALSLGLCHDGKYSEAIAQATKALPLAKESDAWREVGMGYMFMGIAYLGKGDLEKTRIWALKSISQYQKIDQRDELAWALGLMVFVQRGLGQVRSAEHTLHQALEIGINTRGYFPVLCGLCSAALLLLDKGEIEKAVDFAALVWLFPVAANSRWFEDVAGREIAQAAETLPSEVVAAAQERGRARDLWETAAELLQELNGAAG